MIEGPSLDKVIDGLIILEFLDEHDVKDDASEKLHKLSF